MTKLKLACTSFSSFANAHLFTTPMETINCYYNRITRKSNNQRALKSVCDEVRKTISFSRFLEGKNPGNIKRVVRKISTKHNIKIQNARSIFYKCRGVAIEPKCRALYAKTINKCFSRVHEKCIKDFGEFQLQGEIDGVCAGRVTELKARVGGFCYEPPYHDIIQLACYCICMRLPGTLVEFSKNFTIRATNISLNQAEEIIEKLLPTVRHNVYLLYKCLELGTTDLSLIGTIMKPLRSHSPYTCGM